MFEILYQCLFCITKFQATFASITESTHIFVFLSNLKFWVVNKVLLSHWWFYIYIYSYSFVYKFVLYVTHAVFVYLAYNAFKN